MTSTPPESSRVIEALNVLNICEFQYRKEPWALDLYNELIEARKRWAEVVAKVLKEETSE